MSEEILFGVGNDNNNGTSVYTRCFFYIAVQLMAEGSFQLVQVHHPNTELK
jgi:hypothetical protein